MADDVLTLRRGYRFRLYPTPEQVATLSAWERSLKWLWNLAHEQRLMAFWRPKGERPKVDYYSQGREMTALLDVDPRLKAVLCSARQQVLRDLDMAWQRWRKRIGGRPHWKGARHTVSFYVSTTAQWRVEAAALVLRGAASVVGPIKIRQDRPWPSACKFSSCRIVRECDEWYAVFALEETVPVPTAPKGEPVGINRGAVHGIADSDGTMHDAPESMARALDRVRKLSRDVSRKVKGSKNRRKAAVRLAKQHMKIARQREWWQHQQSAHYAKRHPVIALESFDTKRMTRAEPDEKIRTRSDKRALNRRILDVGWYEVARQIEYKAEATGARVVKVDPANISRICSECGCGIVHPASGHADFNCPACGAFLDGDVNAARNVLARGLDALAAPPGAPKARVSLKTPTRKRKSMGETSAKSADEACGGDPPVRGPVEAGTRDREISHHARTVLPTEVTPTHPAATEGLS